VVDRQLQLIECGGIEASQPDLERVTANLLSPASARVSLEGFPSFWRLLKPERFQALLLRRTAQQVAISQADTEEALRSHSTAKLLLGEIRRRIRDGSNRLSDALHRAYRLRDRRDLAGARRLMEDLLQIEVVPLYREQAKILLEELAQL
jgi:DUSAM domain-containing protein